MKRYFEKSDFCRNDCRTIFLQIQFLQNPIFAELFIFQNVSDWHFTESYYAQCNFSKSCFCTQKIVLLQNTIFPYSVRTDRENSRFQEFLLNFVYSFTLLPKQIPTTTQHKTKYL